MLRAANTSDEDRMSLPTIHADALNASGVAHAFFTRQGGVSAGLYASLNGGVGSKDERAHVMENRARMAARLGVSAEGAGTRAGRPGRRLRRGAVRR
mgnify:CR=1 FL=1